MIVLNKISQRINQKRIAKGKGRRNLWTSITGGLMLALGVSRALMDGGEIDESVVALMLTGLGLLKARDGKVVEPEDPSDEEKRERKRGEKRARKEEGRREAREVQGDQETAAATPDAEDPS